MFRLVPLIATAAWFAFSAAAQQPHPPVDRVYDALAAQLRQTPAEEMTETWIINSVYRGHPGVQALLKRILGEPGMDVKNAKMARLRQAIDLRFWAMLARNKGWTVELTSQGKTKGHRSDLDQTGWIIASPEGKRPASFEVVRQMWESYMGQRGIIAAQPDMTIFSGDKFIPDWTNAKVGSGEFTARLAKNVLELRADSEAYTVPGANKQQVHNRALSEGRTIHIAWDFRSGQLRINNQPFDIDAFAAGKADIPYLPAREIAARYRGVRAAPPWRNALGNLAENLKRFLSHSDDGIARQKYANRILDEAFAPILGTTQLDGAGNLQTYAAVHGGTAPAVEKQDFKRKFFQQLLGEDLPEARVAELIRIFDLSVQIEADKSANRPYRPDTYYAPWFPEAEQRVRARHPDAPAGELRQRVSAEAERIFVQKQLEVAAAGAIPVLRFTLEADLTAEGLARQRGQLGVEQKLIQESIRKIYTERHVEIALLFEVVEGIEDTSVRDQLSRNLLDAAPSAPVRASMEKLQRLARAGRDAIDEWLRATAKQGRLAPPDQFYREIEGRIEPIVGKVDEAARRTSKEDAFARVVARVAASLNPDQARKFRAAADSLRAAAQQARASGAQYYADFLDNLNFFFYANTAGNLINIYERTPACMHGGAANPVCGRALGWQFAQDFAFNLPLVDVYGGAALGVLSVNEGDAQGFVDIAMALAPRLGVGAGALQYYLAYKVAELGYKVSVGYLIENLNDDMLELALKSDPSGGTARRCGPGPTLQSDLPGFPIFSATGEIRTAAEGLSRSDRERTARRQFAPAMNQELLQLGLAPLSPGWRAAREKLIGQYACLLPYFERMSRLPEHLGPKLKRYESAAAGRGRDASDMVFSAMDACVTRERRQWEEQRTAAQAQGTEALGTFLAEAAAKPSPILACLPRGIESASGYLRPLLNREIESWLGRQPDHYRDAWKPELSARMADLLVREYVMAQFVAEQQDDANWELERQMAGLAANVSRAERVLRAIATGQGEISRQVTQQVAAAAEQQALRAQPPVKPDFKLLLPKHAVRLGEDVPIDADVKGEYLATSTEDPANRWTVEYTMVLETVEQKPPLNLIVTSALAGELADPQKALYTLRATILAKLKDGGGRTLAADSGEIQYYDVLPKLEKDRQERQTTQAAAMPDMGPVITSLRAAEAQALADSRAAIDECNQAKRTAAAAEASIAALRAGTPMLQASTQVCQDALQRAEQAAATAADLAEKAYGAAQSIGRIRASADQAALSACERMKALRQAAPGADRGAQLAEVKDAVSACRDQLQAARKEVRTALDAARGAESLRIEAESAPSNCRREQAQQRQLMASATAARTQADQAGAAAASAGARALRTRDNHGRAAQLAETGRRQLAPFLDRPEAKSMVAEMEKIVQHIESARQEAAACPDEVAALVKSMNTSLNELERELRTSEVEFARARDRLQSGEIRKQVEESGKRARSSADTAEIFAQSVERAATQAAACQAMAEQAPSATEPDRQTLVARTQSKCDQQFPGSVAVWSEELNKPACLCQGGLAPDAGKTRCINCQEEEARFAAAFNTGDLGTAQAILAGAVNCGWHAGGAGAVARAQQQMEMQNQRCVGAEAQFWAAYRAGDLAAASQIVDGVRDCDFANDAAGLIRSRVCVELEQRLLAAVKARNVGAAQAVIGQAQQYGCNLSPDGVQLVQEMAQMERQRTRNQQWSAVLADLQRLMEETQRRLRQPPPQPAPLPQWQPVRPQPQPQPQAQQIPPPASCQPAVPAEKASYQSELNAASERWAAALRRKAMQSANVVAGHAYAEFPKPPEHSEEIARLKQVMGCFDRCFQSSTDLVGCKSNCWSAAKDPACHASGSTGFGRR